MSIKVIQQPGNEFTAEVLAASIRDIAQSTRRMMNAGLKREAVIALIHDHSGVGKSTIKVVLNNLEELDKIWLKEKK